MTLQSLNNVQFGRVTGYNSYRARQGNGLGSLSYNGSIYGFTPRNGVGARYYNTGPRGTYFQFNNQYEQKESKGKWWKTLLLVGGGALAGWLLGEGNAKKAGNAIGSAFKWIGSLFKGKSDRSSNATIEGLEPRAFEGTLELSTSASNGNNLFSGNSFGNDDFGSMG